MHAIHNARITLFASLLNTMAGSSFTVGVVAPIAATFFYNPTGLHIPLIAIGAMIWTGVAALLHLCAQHVLGRLRSS
jgi:hypothetical protein